MTDIDSQIRSDLEALAGASRRGAGDFAAVAAIIDNRASAYRDERPGVEARRDALVKRRHLELALMPLSLERIFVHRVSRAAAGGAAALCAMVATVGLSQPALIRLTDLMVPGQITLTLASVCVAAAVLISYIVAGWIAERAFERSMRESVASSGDPHDDLDHLARGPIECARALTRRADGWAVGLVLLACATLVPFMAYLTLASAGFAMRPFASIADVASVIASTGDLFILALGMGAGAAVAVAVGRACDREHRSLERPRLIEILSHPIVLVVAAVALLALLAVLGATFSQLRTGRYISEGSRLILAMGGTLAVVAPASWAVLWHRRREQRRLESGANT